MTDRELFAWLCDQTMDGVRGVHRITCGSQTAPVAVIVGSHGKEVTSGLGILRYLQDNPQDFAADYDIVLAVGNIDAARMALAADGDEWMHYRFTPGGRDMNRLPANDADLASIDAPETRRAADLMRILCPLKLDYVLDVHSTDGPSEPAGLGIVGGEPETNWLFARLPVSSVITNVVPVQASRGTKTQTLSSIIRPRLSIEVEVGQTGTPEAAATGVEVFKAWGGAVGILRHRPEPHGNPQAIYRVVDSVMAPDVSYEVVEERLLNEHAEVSKGEPLLRNPAGDEILAETSGLLIWGPSERVLTASDVASEIWFVVQKA